MKQQAIVRRERRPDRAVYVPRARRSQTTPPSAAVVTTTAATVIDNNSDINLLASARTNAPVIVEKALLQRANRNQNSNRSDILKSTTTTTAVEGGATASGIRIKSQTAHRKYQTQISQELLFEQQKQRYENLNILEEGDKEIFNLVMNNSVKSNKIQPIIDCDKPNIIQQQQQQENNINEKLMNVNETTTTTTTTNFNAMINQTNDVENLMDLEREEQNKAKLFVNSDNNININVNNNNMLGHDKLHIEENIEEQELKRASKEMNRSNRRIMKQTFVSDVLEIPEQLPNTQNIVNNHIDSINHHQQQQQQQLNLSTDEDDWDVLYDESGECLDHKIVEEITDAVGKVKLDLPEMDYSMYLSKQKILEKESFPHVLEVSNFPAEFKHQDLLMVFSQYKESGFDIKWVDDTHALAVFSSARIAAEVLTMGHPFVVLKPLSDATPESRAKAKICATSLQPYRPRPETCAALARRLVTGALGVRLKTAAAEREKEKRVLKEAKERKLMAAKQRDETWEN